MPQINCHIPIKVRVKGRPTDAQLEELGQTLVSTLVARLALAEKTIQKAFPDHGGRGGNVQVVPAPFLRSRYDADGGEYAVPSYDSAGASTKLPIQAHSKDQDQTDRIAIQRQSVLRQIHDLLSTDILHWSITGERARQVLHILQKLEPELLLYTVMVMRLIDSWSKFRRHLPDSDQDALIDLEIRIDPNLGYIMPGDTLKVELYAGSRTPDELPGVEVIVDRDGLRLPYLPQPVAVIGLLPQAAADAVVAAYIDALLFVDPFVKIGVYKRGIHYAGRNQGPFASPIYFVSKPRAAVNSSECQRRKKQAEFIDYIAHVSITDSFTTNAIQAYLNWIETQYASPAFLSQSGRSLGMGAQEGFRAAAAISTPTVS